MSPPPRVLCVGIAVLDLIHGVETMPRRADKYRARDAALVGGGCAANAAVAIARLRGDAHFAGGVGDDGSMGESAERLGTCDGGRALALGMAAPESAATGMAVEPRP